MVTRRRNPGTTGKGKFFRIEVRPKDELKSFRIQDAGSKGDTVSWLVSKDDAHVEGSPRHGGARLVITNTKVREALAEGTRGRITHVRADVFRAYPSY